MSLARRTPHVSCAARVMHGGHNSDHAVEAAIARDILPLRVRFRQVWAQNHKHHCPRRGYCKLMVVDGNAKICRDTHVPEAQWITRQRINATMKARGWSTALSGSTRSATTQEL